METIDKLDRIGWIVYIGSLAAMFFLVIYALLVWILNISSKFHSTQNPARPLLSNTMFNRWTINTCGWAITLEPIHKTFKKRIRHNTCFPSRIMSISPSAVLFLGILFKKLKCYQKVSFIIPLTNWNYCLNNSSFKGSILIICTAKNGT